MHNQNNGNHHTDTVLESEGIQLAVMQGMPPGGKIRTNEIFALGITGITFNGEMSLERWRELMRMLRAWKQAGTTWLADAIRHGREQFGDAVVEETLVQMEFDLVDARRAMGIGALTDGVRHSSLTSEHYWVLSKAELPVEDQTKWSALAVEHELTAQQLAKSITAGKVVTNDGASGGGGRASGFATFQGLRQLFDSAWRRVQANDPLEKWDDDRKRALWCELEGPTRVGVMLARELGIPLEAEAGQ